MHLQDGVQAKAVRTKFLAPLETTGGESEKMEKTDLSQKGLVVRISWGIRMESIKNIFIFQFLTFNHEQILLNVFVYIL